MCLLLSGTQSTVRVHYSDVSTAKWHKVYSTCKLQWYVNCWVAHRLFYVYTTVMCLLLSGTHCTVHVNYNDMSTAEWNTEICTCTLQWCVYCWVAHIVLYVKFTVTCLLLSGTQSIERVRYSECLLLISTHSNVRVHYSDVFTPEWHTDYYTCTQQWCVNWWVAHRVFYVYTPVMCLMLSGT
jgi:hypothetical protein